MTRACSNAGTMPIQAQKSKALCIGLYLGKSSYTEDNWINGQREGNNRCQARKCAHYDGS